MAAPIKNVFSLLLRRNFGNSSINSRLSFIASSESRIIGNPYCLHNLKNVNFSQKRAATFFNKIDAENLWKGVVSVSAAGKKRGRGKRVGRKKVTDLNRGQVMGVGKANIEWPGLNSPIMKGKEVLRRKQLPPNPDYAAEIIRLRDSMSRIRHPGLSPLLRGFSGNRFPGQSVGPPDPIGDYSFEGFDTIVLEFKLVANMTGTLGRKQRFSAFVVTGNKNGLAGFGLGKSVKGKSAIRIAKNRAALQLRYINRFENHTVFHNMFEQNKSSKLYIYKKEKGHGLKCHRVISKICNLIGITDLHCKVEGSSANVQAITTAFFNALQKQETHQQLADRMNYHLVEQRAEHDWLPRVVASPSHNSVQEKSYRNEEDIDGSFERIYFDGKVHYQPQKRSPFWTKLKTWEKKCKNVAYQRNQPKAQILREAGLA